MQSFGSPKNFGRTFGRATLSKQSRNTRNDSEGSAVFKMFATRIGTVLAMLPVGIFMVYTSFFNSLPMFIGMIIIGGIISYEIFTMIENRGARFYLWTNSIIATFSCISFYLFGLGIYDSNYLFLIQLSLIILLVLITAITESISGSFESSMENIGISIFTYVLLGLFMPTAGLVKMMDPSGWILTVLLLLTWMTDTGGLVFGKFFGKHRIPNLSAAMRDLNFFVRFSTLMIIA